MKQLRALPAYLLLLAVGRHYLWAAWPAELRGTASKLLGALATLGLVWLVYTLSLRLTPRPSRLCFLVVLYYTYEELQTALCSIAFLANPWVVPLGKSICSARVGFDIGAISIIAGSVLAYRLLADSDL